MKDRRIYPVAIQDPRNENIYAQYPADAAAWLWHDSCKRIYDESMVEFRLELELPSAKEEICFVSADNRFEIFLDGEFLGMGPDRGDKDHWAFSSLEVDFSAGKHVLLARCWFYPDSSGIMPLAQMIENPGFLFGVQAPDDQPLFNTGKAPWKVAKLSGIHYDSPFGWATGKGCSVDFTEYFAPRNWTEPCIQMHPRNNNDWGGKMGGWRLCPSNLPEQMRDEYRGKIKVRAVMDSFGDPGRPFLIPEEFTKESPEMKKWQNFFDNGGPITIDPNVTVGILIDAENYLCAYNELTAVHGKNACVRIATTESLQTEKADICAKGNRNDVAGKFWPCAFQWDEFKNFDGNVHTFTPIWWRAGRFALITIRTFDEPLTIQSLRFMESRYPVEPESSFTADDPRIQDVQPMLVRAMQSCMHETYMDCPYYEQLMYVGDTRLEVLTTYTLAQSPRLPLRALHLFDWSRSVWDGVTAEHYPGRGSQLSCTFSMIWAFMVRDFMMYRNFDSTDEFLHLRRSVRAMLTAMGEYVNEDGIIEHLPGWSFVDWVREWLAGIPYPKKNGGRAAIFSMLYLMSLRAGIELETKLLPGKDGNFSDYYQFCFDRTADAVKKLFWKEEAALFSDEETGEHYSMHAQCLAILSGAIEGQQAERCFQAMMAKDDIAKPTLYFIHYLFDTFCKLGKAEMILDYLNIWTDMKDKGAVTTWEAPEPTRSDCHAWGAHLYYHYFSSIAGIRPASAGFRTVNVIPALGNLKNINGSLIHPDGKITFSFCKADDGILSGEITLPDSVTGKLTANGKTVPLNAGKNVF